MGKTKNPYDPRTPEEWQEAADGAELALLIDSARQYGLIEGGPEYDLERCRWILQEAKQLGIVPAPHAKLVKKALIGG